MDWIHLGLVWDLSRFLVNTVMGFLIAGDFLTSRGTVICCRGFSPSVSYMQINR